MNAKRRVALLDVNVLAALFDPDHVHHDTAHDWFAEHRRGWATCPSTENGFLRVAGRLARNRGEVTIAVLADALRTFTSSGGHERWVDDVHLLDERVFDIAHIAGHQQITDAYLLALAVKHRGALATFDRRISLDAVNGASPDHLLFLAPVD
jgi:uncharacterized protein